MTLKEWADKQPKNQQQLADLFGVHVITFSKWCNGKMFPRPHRMKSIEKITENKVKAIDFYKAL
jgi:DNA-binding transcriptional regulator YdaS (Cro superfamily)